MAGKRPGRDAARVREVGRTVCITDIAVELVIVTTP